MLASGQVCKLKSFKSKAWIGFETKNPVIIASDPIKLSGGIVFKVMDLVTKKRGMVAEYRLHPILAKVKVQNLGDFL